MNQDIAYSKSCEVIFLLKCKPRVDLVEFNSQHLFYFSTIILFRSALNRDSLGSFNFFLPECRLKCKTRVDLVEFSSQHLFYFSTIILLRSALNKDSLGSFNFFTRVQIQYH